MVIVRIIFTYVGDDGIGGRVSFVCAEVNTAMLETWVSIQVCFGLVDYVAPTIDAKAVGLQSPIAPVSSVSSRNFGVIKPDVEIWQFAIIFGFGIEIGIVLR